MIKNSSRDLKSVDHYKWQPTFTKLLQSFNGSEREQQPKGTTANTNGPEPLCMKTGCEEIPPNQQACKVKCSSMKTQRLILSKNNIKSVHFLLNILYKHSISSIMYRQTDHSNRLENSTLNITAVASVTSWLIHINVFDASSVSGMLMLALSSLKMSLSQY